LMTYALDRLPAKDRTYLVREMRSVDANQQWGVWGVGPAARPGNKNGWDVESKTGVWITNTVGFVGPGERFTLSIMNYTNVVHNGYGTGKETTTTISSTLFHGYFNT
ncbi:MAG: tat pathway signal sequence, partial [Mycobacteriales bacterium]